MMKKRGYGERNPHQGLPQVDNHEIDRLELLAAVGETCSPKKYEKIPLLRSRSENELGTSF
jgi:hypothetical protein